MESPEHKLLCNLRETAIHVRFDRPTALQIDGEVFSGVTEYTVTTAVADGRKRLTEAVPKDVNV